MSLSVKMSGENVADLSVATGKNDTEMGSHANLGNLLIGASKTFTGFSEDLPSAGSTVCTSGAYAQAQPVGGFLQCAQRQQPALYELS
ncbi:MAG: hypothetical protein WCE73_09870 [Candidatus Angelobacter sp.]